MEKAKKIIVLGAGNAGAPTALHYGFYTRNYPNIEVELIYDPEIDPVPVGQGSTLNVPNLLHLACGTDWYTNEIHATPKLGILYENWSKKNKRIFSGFSYNSVAVQMDPKYFQDYILNSGWFGVKKGNVTNLNEVDADVIFDCRGNNKKDKDNYDTLYIPVNSVLLATSTSNDNTLNWTRAVATPDGWTFVIPNTTDTISYGYLFNRNITSPENAKTNFIELFDKEFPNEIETVNMNFESYIAKTPVRIEPDGRKIILSGNRLAFLEPLEATAIAMYLEVAQIVFDWVVEPEKDDISQRAWQVSNIYRMNEVNKTINTMIHELHTFILWHYTKKSIYDTPFWREAQVETTSIFKNRNEKWEEMVYAAKEIDSVDLRCMKNFSYGQWGASVLKLWYDGYIKG